MLIAHEHQHNETMLQLLQMVDGYEPPDLGGDEQARGIKLTAGVRNLPTGDGTGVVEVPAGTHRIGAPSSGFAYDNERPCHEVDLSSFAIDREPVSNGEFAAYMAESGAEPPLYWERDGDEWVSTTFGRRTPLDLDAPVIHVDHHQATAFAAWRGSRLPTEIEWEVAASGADPGASNLDHAPFGSSPPSAASASDHGVLGMLGDVWEWTSSELTAYPGFGPFPYPAYSEVFFDSGYPVLRGGSWATRRSVIRTTFRNWDLPERRQIFSGFRCAQDTE